MVMADAFAKLYDASSAMILCLQTTLTVMFRPYFRQEQIA